MKSILSLDFRLFTLFNVPLTIHISLLIFLVLFAVFSPHTLLLALLTYISVVPHEYGHVLAAKYYGIGCKKIMMFPLGGIAMLEGLPRDWLKELWIVAWGPIVSLILALWSAALAVFTFNITPIFFYLAAINGILFIFNVLPIYPMDGGRILRAALSTHFSYEEATRIAVRVGQGMAGVVGVLGLLSGNLFIIVVMIFIVYGGESELRQLKN